MATRPRPRGRPLITYAFPAIIVSVLIVMLAAQICLAHGIHLGYSANLGVFLYAIRFAKANKIRVKPAPASVPETEKEKVDVDVKVDEAASRVEAVEGELAVAVASPTAAQTGLRRSSDASSDTPTESDASDSAFAEPLSPPRAMPACTKPAAFLTFPIQEACIFRPDSDSPLVVTRPSMVAERLLRAKTTIRGVLTAPPRK